MTLSKQEITNAKEIIDKTRKEISKTVVGQIEVVDGILRGIICNGHCLLEGVPGIAKTLLIRTLAKVSGCEFKRIQFTVDLLPADIVGITAYDEKKGFYTMKGPIFSNFIIADEINRATPKTQSALLEAMQEKMVTIGNETFPLPKPFFVMATQNPLESMGVYPLPRAQEDRFLFKLLMGYPKMEEESKILKQNMTLRDFDSYELETILTPEKIEKIQTMVKDINMQNEIEEYIVKIIDATRNPEKYNSELGKYLEYGASPRASIAMFIGSKADALLRADSFVTPQHVKNIAHDVLRHRMILNYEGEAAGITTDQVISEIINKVPVP